MRISQQQHLTNSVKIPVVVVYVLFFSVHLFFNFNTANRTNNHCGSTISAVSSSVTTIVKVNTQPVKKVNVRLNKRFQPANVPGCNPFYIEIPLCFIEIKKGFCRSNPVISTYQISARTLRGPPNVV